MKGDRCGPLRCGRISKDRVEGAGGEGGGKMRLKVTYVYVVGIDIIGAGVCEQRVELDSMAII